MAPGTMMLCRGSRSACAPRGWRLADGDHSDEGGDADEYAQHGERRAHLIASDRLGRGGEHHETERQMRTCRNEALFVLRLQERKARDPLAYRSRLAHALIGNNLAVAHRHDAVRIGGDVSFVCDKDDRQPLLTVERDQRFHNLVRGFGIEVAGRLVGKQQAW